MSKITDHITVGSVEESFNLQSNIKSVLNVASEIDIEYRINHIYKKIATNDDDPNCDITSILPDCISFIKENKPTFIHCLEGVSRSVCVCIAYLVIEEKYTFNDALELLKNKRNIDAFHVFPLYLEQLEKYLNNI